MTEKKSRFAALAPYSGPEPIIEVYQMPPREIGYLTSLAEAYDGIGLVRTLDESRGIIELWIMPGYADVFERLLEALRKEFPIQKVDLKSD